MERLYSAILFIFRIIGFLVLPIKIIILNFRVEVGSNIVTWGYILFTAGACGMMCICSHGKEKEKKNV